MEPISVHNIARARSRKRTMDIALPGSAWLPRYTLIRLLPALSLLSSLVHIGSNVETNSSEERLHSRDARRRELAIRSCRRRASTCTKQQHSGPPHWLRPGRTSPSRSRWGSRCMLRVAGWLPHSGCCSGRWRCAGWQPDDSVVLGSAAGMLSVRLPVGVFELGCLKPKDRLR